ncbi:hypothetical protein AsAng_0061910 [Aureispira anguillae]|uniref:Uncharacterized protein n=1 Tax=Aureispira anguillae TaxID=2864201 RepID=A0A915YLG4_9BACT|nr:hypothetical protein AsAng_0061910 [Aureispira anguillae]
MSCDFKWQKVDNQYGARCFFMFFAKKLKNYLMTVGNNQRSIKRIKQLI